MSSSVISSGQLDYTKLIAKNSNDFSFTQEMINAVNNFDFKKTAYNTLSGNYNTVESYIWTALSNIAETSLSTSLLHENISEQFETDILNFVDNIANIDTCKIQCLQSMINQLGINYSIFDKLHNLPLQILKLIDVLSIKKEYLLQDNKVKKLFAQILKEQISSDISVDKTSLTDTILSINEIRNSSAEISAIDIIGTETTYISNLLSDALSVNYSPYIDSNELYNFTSAVYAKVLSNYCYLRYNTPVITATASATIVDSLSNSIILSDFTIENTDINDLNEIKNYRLKYNVPKDFSQTVELDKIESGNKQFSDYNIHEQHLLSLEQTYRNRALNSKDLYSRYYYYRQKAVREYYKFIENEFTEYIESYLSTVQYPVNNKYLDITNIKKRNLYRILGSDTTYSIDNSMIDNVAQLLASITKSIQDIREQVKTQVQKNFMKGTKIHLSYIIREYIKNNIYPVYKQLYQTLKQESKASTKPDPVDYQVSDVIININEYTDNIEYFNLSTYKDSETDNVNSRFWETTHYINDIKPHNSNNIFGKVETIKGSSKVNLTFNDVYNMFNQTLQMSLNVSTQLSTEDDYINNYKAALSNFLNNVYNTGADTTYLDENGNICCAIDFPELSDLISNYTSSQIEDFREYKDELFKKYTGLSIGSESFFNLKNKKHPSYQIHPYIQNFEYIDEATYPIDNIANVISEKLTDMLYNSLSDYIDKDGYLQNVWNNAFNTNQDYITEYEKSTNTTNLGTVKPWIDYDGLFYPDAICCLNTNSVNFCNDIKNNTNKFYKDNELNQTEREELANQITTFKQTLGVISKNANYCIYRYGKDYYGNSYILVKQTESSLSDYANWGKTFEEDNRTRPGIMFMKKKNHSIALPMMIFDKKENNNTVYNPDLSQIKTISSDALLTYSNDYFKSCVLTDVYGTTKYQTPKVYDFSISKDKTQLMFAVKAGTTNKVIHANIKKIYDNSLTQQKYNFYLTKDTINSKEDVDECIDLNGYQLVDFYNYINNPGVIGLSTQAFSDMTNNVMSCTIYMPYWDRDDKYGDQIKQQFKYTISCENYLSLDTNTPKVSVNDKKQLITIAYLNNKNINSLSFTDSLGRKLCGYPAISSINNIKQDYYQNIDTLNTSITTKELVYNSKLIKEKTNLNRQYAIYGSMGFIKTYLGDSNNINNNEYCWLSSLALKQQLKFELCGPKRLTSDKDKGIKFKFVVPLRFHEAYATKPISELNIAGFDVDNNISIGDYNKIRFSETSYNDGVGTETNEPIFDPIQFTKELGTNYNISNLTARIDESFTERLKVVANYTGNPDNDYPEMGKTTFDRFHDIPYAFSLPNDIANYPFLYAPGSEEAKDNNVNCNSNVYIINIYSSKRVDDMLSVQWMYNSLGTIKLDFNAQWYNYYPNIHSFDNNNQVKNYYNVKHQFLNLDRPGESGYIWLQTLGTNNNLIPTHVYYIKNISDSRPKFILQLADDFINNDVIEDISRYWPLADCALANNKDDTGTILQNYNNDYILVNLGDNKLYLENYIDKN